MGNLTLLFLELEWIWIWIVYIITDLFLGDGRLPSSKLFSSPIIQEEQNVMVY